MSVFIPRSSTARMYQKARCPHVLEDVKFIRLCGYFLRRNASVTADSYREPQPLIDKTTSFAFSGCGWLTPFYFGVVHKMQQSGYLTKKSLVAGTSGGSLGALVAVSGLEPRVGLDLMIEMSLDKSFKNNIDLGLRRFLPDVLPDDIAFRSNRRLHVCVTKVWPNPTGAPHIISQFDDKKNVVDAVAASCFIPLYSSPRGLFTTIMNNPLDCYIDGGVFGFMPPIGDVRVSPFNVLVFKRYPHIQIKANVFSAPRLLSWVLTPAPPDILEELYNEGYRAAEEWIAAREEV